MFVIFSVFYILVAASMIVLILMQRGTGADAGSGFGAGASATVFGARGSANFMSRSTAVLAALFFLLSLGMGIYLKMHGGLPQNTTTNLGVMVGVGKQPATTQNAAPVVPTAPVAPAANNGDVPAAQPVQAKSDVPAAASTAGKK